MKQMNFPGRKFQRQEAACLMNAKNIAKLEAEQARSPTPERDAKIARLNITLRFQRRSTEKYGSVEMARGVRTKKSSKNRSRVVLKEKA